MSNKSIVDGWNGANVSSTLTSSSWHGCGAGSRLTAHSAQKAGKAGRGSPESSTESPTLSVVLQAIALVTLLLCAIGNAARRLGKLRLPAPSDDVGSTSGVTQIAADLAAPPEVGRPGAEILQPLPQARKDGLSSKTELLTGPRKPVNGRRVCTAAFQDFIRSGRRASA
jgi:hypothetical protein